jgi:hypothetical protein
MKRGHAYNPFPGAPASRRSRRDDAADRDTRAAALRARNLEMQEKRDAAVAAAKEAVGKPAANDDQTEKKQNG